jgi:hypothetical protein
MIKHINWKEVSKQIAIHSNNVVVLLKRLGMESQYGHLECARNVYLVNNDGVVIWQVTSDFDSDGGSFTNVIEDSGKIKAYRWDGGMYKIDSVTGYAAPILLMK